MSDRYYIVQETAYDFRPLPYTENGFASRSAAYRFMREHGDGWCKVSKREAALHN
jgi:hypothetical protein